jgi:hypothetical protein
MGHPVRGAQERLDAIFFSEAGEVARTAQRATDAPIEKALGERQPAAAPAFCEEQPNEAHPHETDHDSTQNRANQFH